MLNDNYCKNMNNIITIRNIQEYNQQIINGDLVLTLIIPFIDEQELFKRDLRGSFILKCQINFVNYEVKKYKKLLIILYSTTDIETILQNTILNISREEINDKGFEYYSHLGVSIQGSETRRTLREILNFIKIKKYNIELKLKLKNDEIVRFII